MTTLTLSEAAHFLKVHPDWLRKEAKAGRIPGRKIGRIWRFIEEDLVVWLRSGYAENRQVPALVEVPWDYTKGGRPGGSILPPHQETVLDVLLKQ